MINEIYLFRNKRLLFNVFEITIYYQAIPPHKIVKL